MTHNDQGEKMEDKDMKDEEMKDETDDDTSFGTPQSQHELPITLQSAITLNVLTAFAHNLLDKLRDGFTHPTTARILAIPDHYPDAIAAFHIAVWNILLKVVETSGIISGSEFKEIQPKVMKIIRKLMIVRTQRNSKNLLNWKREVLQRFDISDMKISASEERCVLSTTWNAENICFVVFIVEVIDLIFTTFYKRNIRIAVKLTKIDLAMCVCVYTWQVCLLQ